MTKKAELTIADKTQTMIKQLDERIKGFDNISDSKYKTSGNLTGYGNIQKIEDIQSLIKAHASVTAQERLYNEASDAISKKTGLKTWPVFQLDGAEADALRHDIELRIQILTHHQQLEKLKALREKAKSFLTQEEQKAIFAEELNDFLNA